MMKKDHVENDVFLIMYMQLPKIPEQTFRLFRWTDGHYTVHEGNARLLALHHYGSDSVLSEWTTSSTLSNQISIKTCKISANSITGVVFCILDILCSKIEIWEREKLGEWFCSKHVSPAYTLDLYSDLSEENSILFSKDRKILAISFPKRLCGKQTFDLLICVCVIDIDNQHCDIAEITDCEDSFLNLQNILTSVNPSELWIVNESNKTKNTKIRKLAEDFKIFIHDITQKPSGIEQENDQHLQVFDKQSIRILNYPENEITLYSVVVPVMKQLKLESKVQLSQQFTVSLIKSERYMRLDRAAVKAMMLFNDDVRLRSAKPTGNDAIGCGVKEDDINCLYDVLNNCKTRHGSRLLRSWMMNPLTSYEEIVQRQDLISAMLEDECTRMEMQNCIKCLPDMSVIIRRLLFSACPINLEMCYKLYVYISSIPNIVAMCRNANSDFIDVVYFDLIRSLELAYEHCKDHADNVANAIDFDRLASKREFTVKSTINSFLSEAAESITDLEKQIAVEHDKICDRLCSKSVRLEYTSRLGYFCRVSCKEQRVLNSFKNEFDIFEVRKDGVKFVNKEIKAINEEYEVSKSKFQVEQDKIVQELSHSFGLIIPILKVLDNTIAKLDVIMSLAAVANNSTFPYCRPIIHLKGTGVLKLIKSRHPWIERQSCTDFISNDVKFDKDARKFCILTGPNMGGKSTYIRQIGLNILLAQIGSFVPCEYAEIPIFTGLYARFGSSDNIVKGQSTLMTEMIEASYVLKVADEYSFVMIDELGRGTSSRDGFSIAWAIIRYLLEEIGCFGAFATHFHQLSELSKCYKKNGLFNAHVKAVLKDNEFIPLYQVEEGPTNESHGISIARSINFPVEIIKDAEQELIMSKSLNWINLIEDTEQRSQLSAIISDEMKKITFAVSNNNQSILVVKDIFYQLLKRVSDICLPIFDKSLLDKLAIKDCIWISKLNNSN